MNNKYFKFAALSVVLFALLVVVSSYKGGILMESAADAINANLHVDKNGKYDLAGEEVPMNNFDAVERLDREIVGNTYLHGSTILNLKLAARYFPYFEKTLAENNVPDDMKYLAVIESNLRNVISPAGAKGLWQFMEATGKAYDLEINKEVDERYHVEKSTLAFCRHIKDLKNALGSWTLASAAYNAGQGRINTEQKNQRANNFYELSLVDETSRYPFRIIALKEIMKDPKKYGFSLDEDNLYAPINNYSIVEVNGKVDNWGDFAIKYGTNYRMLKVYNPWIINHFLTNPTGKTYQVKIPK
ncbi:MAG: lytic transglycosylase domain-containing protein [Saprospiraceae bacterium]|nr:lytic transglycosylase domain-containing protein [Saprospiraceae bacterium]